MTFRRFAIGLVVALAGGCGPAVVDKGGAPTATPGPLTLTVESVFDGDTIDGFVSSLESGSHGTLRLAVTTNFDAGQADSEATAIADVRAGGVDLALVGTRALATEGISALDALQTPFAIDSYPLERAVLASAPVVDAVAAIDTGTLVGIGVLPGDLRYILARDRAFLRPADFAGARIAVSGSTIGERSFRALGALPTPIGGGAPITAYDAVEVSIAGITGNHYDDVARFVGANVVPWPRPIAILMSKARFDRLTREQGETLRAAARNALDPMLGWAQGIESEFLATACRRGVAFETASPGDLAALRAAVQPAVDGLRADPAGRALLADIETLKSRSAAPIATAGCATTPVPATSPTASPSAAASLIDGAWTACPTEAQILSAGGSAGEAAGNAGCTTLVFDHGAFREDGASASTSAPGTYEVDGTRVTISRSNGEVFALEWSVFDGSLEFRRSTAGVSPAPWLAAPFTREPG